MTWPVMSGTYRVMLFRTEWPEWDLSNCPWCDDCSKIILCDWGIPIYKLIQIKEIGIKSQQADFLAYSQLYYVSSDDQDTLRNGATMEVDRLYDVVCQIQTSKSPGVVPDYLIGYLEPEGVEPPTEIIFTRDPAGDFVFPCEPEYPYRIYGYRCYDSFMPYTLFPGIDPPEWAELTRYLDCKLYRKENQSCNDISIRTTIMSYLQLDCTNDSTVCFRPAAGEDIEFVFRWGREMGLDSETDARFKISDKDGIGVYEESLTIPYLDEFEIDPNLPRLQPPDTMTIIWDGRQNIGDNDGHIADPDLSSYNAIVQIFDDFGNPMMETNIETFNVVPVFDSVLLTHHPFYPPPVSLETTTLYSVLRTIIDDSEVAEENIRYYAGPETPPHQNPSELGFWVNEYENENYMFWDYYDPEWPPHRKFYENNLAQTIPLSNWDTEKFGELNYTWRVIHDGRATQMSVSYDEIVDTTESWGNSWAVDLRPPINWTHADQIPYMRFLVMSYVHNLKNEIPLQEGFSPGGADAHKLMFAHNWMFPEWDIADWAVSHIGVPYARGDTSCKIPYIKNDCSGFVTTTRIQELDECGPGYLMVSWITAYDYYDGDFWVPGHTVDFTEHVDNPCDEPYAPGWRGYLLFIRDRHEAKPWSRSRHIMIIYGMNYDCLRSRVINCHTIHAKGDYQAENGRVRYDDNVVGLYPRYDPQNGLYGDWIWTFLKFR